MKNTVILIGRLGADPETKELKGKTLTKISLATSETWKDKNGERKEKTEWHRVEVWGKLAEVIKKHFTKGQEIAVTGSIHYNENEGKWYTSIRMKEFAFVGSKGSVASESQAKQSAPEQEESTDLPF